MESFTTLKDAIKTALVSTTRSAAAISAADLAFQRSLNPQVGTALDAQNARLLHLAQRLLENAAASSDAVGPKLPDAEAIDSNWKGVVDVIDSLLEKADTSLDEYTGVVKRMSPGSEQAPATVTPRTTRASLAASKHIAKPQLLFDHVPRNNETGAFRPLLTSKPHAKVSLAESLTPFKDNSGHEQYPHPYQTEIETYEYPQSMYEQAEPQPYTPFESTTAIYVDTPEALAAMLAELKTAKEIAIDLEHHDNRSYIGIVSLMQISTRSQDWIVDTLKPWRRRLECLNEVFADPNILKVLHGAFMDIIWLQRDLGLYIVGLFDTFHAARALGYPGASLAYLLDRFVQFKAQKQYQMADWRIRPLTPELFEYARADTHFLLYVLDNLRNELVEKSDFSDPERDKVTHVLQKSKEVALQRYEHPIYDSELGLGPVSWYKLWSRTPANFTPSQFAIFKAVHKWRDTVAREEDESPLFIMPNHAIFNLARSPPADKAALYSLTQHVSHQMRARSDQLINIIQKAKADGANGPDMNSVLSKIDAIQAQGRPAFGSTPMKPTPMKPTPAFPSESPSIQKSPLVAKLDSKQLRATSSSFWGRLLPNGSVEQRRPATTLSVNLALPLPPLTAEVFADPAGAAEESPEPTRAEHKFVPKEERPQEDERTDIFVVRQVGGRKRKHGETAETTDPAAQGALDPMLNDEVMLENSEEEEQSRKKEEKARRKAARKEEKKRQKAEALNYEEEQPAFDYANATSVLHAQEAEGDKKKGKKDKKKKPQGFNPYGNMGGGPRGLPRAQKEKAGKSRTFTS
ncbi:hypothetical protein BS50DRAFT_120014 [Corynespora cassiicola Philippines]|uniref:HRDC domain-containing protein n=1 Tax=Corynespora cassiicola Philippines TaxID=1448308 RepID=A0A2T2NAK9_CORCC|nr:hypothetical protein BS50DRAFT_120014 [Corynespora cassiicola Philippines]